MSWNLVVATGWRLERLCMEELYRIGDIVGRKIEEVWFTGFDGLLTAKVEGDSVEFVKMLIEVVNSGYYIPRYVLRATPIMVVVKTDLDEVQRATSELAERLIQPNETFKIELKKRGVKFDRSFGDRVRGEGRQQKSRFDEARQGGVDRDVPQQNRRVGDTGV
jgi:tRNA acetyltransferase TAN1